mgnify:CR=1 FL=1
MCVQSLFDVFNEYVTPVNPPPPSPPCHVCVDLSVSSSMWVTITTSYSIVGFTVGVIFTWQAWLIRLRSGGTVCSVFGVFSWCVPESMTECSSHCQISLLLIFYSATTPPCGVTREIDSCTTVRWLPTPHIILALILVHRRPTAARHRSLNAPLIIVHWSLRCS